MYDYELGDPGRCWYCGEEFQWVRPGKSQATCMCSIVCEYCGGEKSLYSSEDTPHEPFAGWLCSDCEPFSIDRRVIMREKLLMPGWAGELDNEELAFVKKRLKADRKLRTRWGFVRGTGHMNDEMIRGVAMEGPEILKKDGYIASTRKRKT